MVFNLFAEQETPQKKREMATLEKPVKRGLFRKLAAGLSKTRKNLNEGFDRLISSHVKLDDEFMDELEEILFSSDIGAEITMRVVNDLRRDVKKNLLQNSGEVIEFVKKELVAILLDDVPSADSTANSDPDGPFVLLVIGVNGSGKTTTIGKMAHRITASGHSVIMAAADTFRAAAIEQLGVWAERAGADFVRHQSGSDPSAVAYDAAKAAVSRKRDILLIDTAGRLHSKVNLMEELKKIRRVIDREIPGAPHETLLVLDATTGQNAVNQARLFHEAVGITGIVLTKLDGTAKGGVVINIMDTLKIPVKLIGIGEGVDDLRPFNPEEFVAAIFSGANLVDENGSG